MQINQYTVEAHKTDKAHKTLTLEESAIVDYALGLGGECGEVVDLVKHAIFHNEGINKFKLTKELGDVMWYLVHIAEHFDIPMDKVLDVNVVKLRARYPEGYNDDQSKARHQIEAQESLMKYYLNWRPNDDLYRERK